MMKVKILIVVLSLLAGFLCGYFSPRKIYIDMPGRDGGWWFAAVSGDGYEVYTSLDNTITIKTLYKEEINRGTK
jgi:hypothetical protein